jgi:hypothetical protein
MENLSHMILNVEPLNLNIHNRPTPISTGVFIYIGGLMELTVADVVELPKNIPSSFVKNGSAFHNGRACGYAEAIDEISSLKLSPEKVVGIVEFNEQEIWKVLQEVHGCKKSGEDCNFHRCNNIGECQLLVEHLISNKSKILGLKGKYDTNSKS